MEDIQVECAWHSKYFGERKIIKAGNPGVVSHGICKECSPLLRVEILNVKICRYAAA